MEHNPFSNPSEDDSQADVSEALSDSTKSDEKGTKKKKKRASGGWVDSREAVRTEKPDLFDPSEREDTSEKKFDLLSLFEKSEKSQQATPEVPEYPEELSDSEAQHVARQIIEAHDEQLQQELVEADPDSSEEAEVLSAALFVDALEEKIRNGEVLDESALDDALEEVVADLAIETGNEPIAGIETTDTADIPKPDDLVPGANTPSPARIPLPPNPAVPTPPMPPVSPPSGSHASGSGEGGFGGGGGMAAPVVSSASTPRFNVAPAARVPEASNNRYQRGADLLVGGIVGYLIGRRRGRINTEKRLLPVQKTLEKQVRDLNDKIIFREQKIRTLTAEKVAREGEDARRVIVDKVEAKAPIKSEHSRKKIEQQESRTAFEQPTMRERRPERMASVLLSGAELVALHQAESTPATVKETVRTMSDVELLAVAAKVEIGGQTAKQLYEQGRVSKEDIRAVAVEQMVGQGRAEKTLAERLKPIRPMELTKEFAPSDSDELAKTSTSINTDIPLLNPSQAITNGLDDKQIDASAMAEALIAQQAAKDRGSESHALVWVTLAVVVVAVAVVAFLF